MNPLVAAIVQGLVLMIVAPLTLGIMELVAIRLQLGWPPRVYQPYLDLYKNFRKSGSLPSDVSVIFAWAPVVVFACYALLGFVSPVFALAGLPLLDLVGIAAMLGLAKFVLCLAGFDLNTPTGGMASSREMFLHVLLEPVIFATLFAIAAQWHTTDPVTVIAKIQQAQPQQYLAIWLTLAALLFVLLGETGRLPVDSQTSSLELTMFQKALGADYSTWRLALIHWADAIRLTYFLTLAINFLGLRYLAVVSGGWLSFALAGGLWLVLLSAAASLLAVWEATQVKRRLLRVANFFLIGMGFGVLGVILAAVTG